MARKDQTPKFGAVFGLGFRLFGRRFIGLAILVIVFAVIGSPLSELLRDVLGRRLAGAATLILLVAGSIVAQLWIIWRLVPAATGKAATSLGQAAFGIVLLRLPIYLPIFVAAVWEPDAIFSTYLNPACCCVIPFATIFSSRWGTAAVLAWAGVDRPIRTAWKDGEQGWGPLALVMIFEWAFRLLVFFGFCAVLVNTRDMDSSSESTLFGALGYVSSFLPEAFSASCYVAFHKLSRRGLDEGVEDIF